MKSKKLFLCLAALTSISAGVLASCGETTSTTVTPPPSTETTVTTAPVTSVTWTGLEKAKFHAGSVTSFDLLAGVTAVDQNNLPLIVVVSDDSGFDAAYASDYYIQYQAKRDNVVIETKERIISVLSSLTIENGNFADPNLASYFLTEKEGFLPGGGTGTREVLNEELKVEISAASTESWKLQLKYVKPLDFIGGHTYKFTFRFKGDGHSVSGGAENAGLGMLYKGFMPVASTSDWQTYTQYLPIKDDATGVQPVITMGYGIDFDATATPEAKHTLYIDDLALTDVTDKVNKENVTWENADDVASLKGGKTGYDALAKVVAKDSTGAVIDSSKIVEVGELPNVVKAQSGLQKSYRITHDNGNVSFINRKLLLVIPKDKTYELADQNFDGGLTYWNYEDSSTNTVNFAAEGGAVSATFADNIPTDANWKIQLWQGGISWEKGFTYYVTYRVKASKVGMHLHTEINNNAHWAKSHTDLIFTEADTYVDYKVGPFYMAEDVNNWSRISNLLGYAENKNGTITWDSISVSRVAGDETPKRTHEYSLFNEDFTYGLEYWTGEANDAEYKAKFAANTTDKTISVAVDAGLPGNRNFAIQVFQAAPTAKWVVGNTYVVTYTAKASKANMVFFSEIFQGATTMHNLTLDFAEYTHEITITEGFDFKLGRVSALFGEKVNAGGTITLKSIVISQKI